MPPTDSLMLSLADLNNAFKFFKNEPQQADGVVLLYAAIHKADPKILNKTHPWFQRFTEAQSDHRNGIKVPYFSQLDNASGTGYRECFSSSCAMLAAFHGKVKGDDEYNTLRARYGDSTDAQAQLAALRALGLKADFRTDGIASDLTNEIDADRPVAVGWLHRGAAIVPAGGGHWTVITGYTKDAFIMNDPNGEADLVSGGYINHTNGKSIAYSMKNWIPRWRVGGTAGWMLTVRP